ncbi:alpha/beta hydrolase [Citricoccus sp.]|uniref:alpha/beta fold hydrolase n=2 Tax=Micrococcales TaxID=85006 RepID=UPI00160BDD23|nr:alpha/beta hydrolase [Citricoccus sp.]MBB5750515.1 pimeloyl-ACP methyl ester carboxylesterase [Micrococcus sp. TA1]HRO94053.1 alpha/beta hydrolase [Citricoccus sp.]
MESTQTGSLISAVADDGTPLAVQVLGAGSGPPVLVLPGGPCRSPEYLEDLAGLAGTRTLAVLHPRGTPATGSLSRGWWTDAADVVSALDALGLDRADLIAHSAGAQLALAAATRYPGRVRSLLLVTPSLTWLTDTEHDGAAIAARRTEPVIGRAMASLAGPAPRDEARFQADSPVQRPAGYARWTLREQEHSPLGSTSLAASGAWSRDIPEDAADRVRQADLPPTLVIGGTEDILVGDAPVRAGARVLGARLEMIGDCGHYPWVEQPEAFRGLVDPWVAQGVPGPRVDRLTDRPRLRRSPAASPDGPHRDGPRR